MSRAVIAAYEKAQIVTTEKRAFMIVSDLCGSSEVTTEDIVRGSGLQAAHEALCLEVSGKKINSASYKAMGDGVMMEVDDPVKACRIGLELVEAAERLRVEAQEGQIPLAFEHFRLKVVIVGGEYRRAQGTQRWIGVLPTKASRIAAVARQDEVWIDNSVAVLVRSRLGPTLAAQCDENPANGAAFCVPLKGFGETPISIHLLRKSGSERPFTGDELKKVWQISWAQAMVGIKTIVRQIQESGFSPDHVVGIGRSGSIVGGIIAGNLGHLPIDVIERRHGRGPRRLLSTITEQEVEYNGDQIVSPDIVEPRAAWRARRVLLAIGEAKTAQSFASAHAWLNARGVMDIKTAALMANRTQDADYCWMEALNAWLPWQYASGYDRMWPSFARNSEP